MSKVYVVTYLDDEDGLIVDRVFSTEKSAKDYCNRGFYQEGNIAYSYEEVELDSD